MVILQKWQFNNFHKRQIFFLPTIIRLLCNCNGKTNILFYPASSHYYVALRVQSVLKEIQKDLRGTVHTEMTVLANTTVQLSNYIYTFWSHSIAFWDPKGLVHAKMKISPWFTRPQAILGVYDWLSSFRWTQLELNQTCPGSSQFNNVTDWRFWSTSIHYKSNPYDFRGLIKAFWIHIYNFKHYNHW